MSKVWFTSDTHFGHANIIKYSNRPFANVYEMNAEMIARWNETVGERDIVYHLGDVAFLKARQIENDILPKLNGRKILIKGNHDQQAVLARGWEGIHSTLEISHEGHHIVLCHYGQRVWNRGHRGALHLYGHSHGQLPGNSQSLDVGVDCWNYTPVSLAQILDRMATLPKYTPEDFHHA